MPMIASTALDRYRRLHADMITERRPWLDHWRLLSDYILPRRYIWLTPEAERGRAVNFHNPLIIDGTPTVASRTLAAGMMNGITSPARPWFRLSAPQFRDNVRVIRWLEEAQEDMLYAMSESNFYNAMAVQYLDLAVFQTSAMLIYEDDEDVFRCYNYALGEYAFAQNNRHQIDRFAREFSWRVEQIVTEFGLENCSDWVKQQWDRGAEGYNQRRVVCHIIEPNGPPYRDIGLPQALKYREIYWEKGAVSSSNNPSTPTLVDREPGNPGTSNVLRVRGFYEWPGSCPRWEVVGNDAYGAGPSFDALPDIKQLQHMAKRKLQALDYMISPPVVADIQLQHRPTALLPRGITYVAGANNIGVKPVYTINPPFREISEEIARLQGRIQEYYHNDLFRMISNLETVRSATEIDARREEKLVLLGPVLDRFQSEALDPAVRRIFSIMLRNGLFADMPPELEDTNAQIAYTSVLSDAQRAVAAAPLERFVAFVGNLSGAVPEALAVPKWPDLIREYGRAVGVSERSVNTEEEVAQAIAQQKAAQAMQQAAETALPAAQSAKLLSETPVGGAGDALSLMLGNA